MEKLIELGVDRVLTSGLEETVTEGMETLKSLIEQAGDRIIVMPGCGITERNFTRIQQALGAKEYHVALDCTYESRMTYRPDHIYMGGMLRQTEFSVKHTDKGRLGAVVSHKGGM
jgi:copper homeostasis protein